MLHTRSLITLSVIMDYLTQSYQIVIQGLLEISGEV